jgi:protein phosphatase
MGPPAPAAHRLRYVARTDRGLLRATNQDSVFAGDRLLVVADGMGGHAAGDTAARRVVDAFAPPNAAPPGPDLIRTVLSAVRTGNASIKGMVDAHPDLEGMGTTVTAMLFDGRRAALAHVGDSRAYLYREGVLHQLTHDDTFVQSLVDDGRITEHQAHEHPQRNLLLRALTGLEPHPMLVERGTKPGDRYMLCSDGLCGVVDPESIADALSHPDPEVAADTLIQLALVAGGPDNVTTIVADVLSTGDDPITAPQPVITADPANTNPISRLTREMPRVPLPPIPEEPAAPADVIDDEYDDADEYDEDREPGDDLETDTADAATTPEDGDAGDGAGTEARGSTGTDRAGAPATKSGATEKTRGATRPDERAARWHWYRRGAALVAALVLLGAAITGATTWVRHQYYVSEQGNLVVVFRGVNGSLLGWGFPTCEETSCAGATDCTPMKVSDLQPGAQNQVRLGMKATSLKNARAVVQRLPAQLLPPCPDPADLRDGHDDTAETSRTAPTEPSTATTVEPSPATTTASAPAPTTNHAAASLATKRAVPTTTALAAGAVTGAADRTAVRVADHTVAGTTAARAGSRAATAAAAGTTGATTAAGTTAAGTTTARTNALAEFGARAGTDHEGAVIPGVAPRVTPGDTSSSPAPPSSPTNTIDATPLAPPTQTPGVTCRTVS